jgi:hypothetical protein
LFAEIYSNNALQKTREKAAESERETRRKERPFAAIFFCRRMRVFLWLFKEKRLLFWERKQGLYLLFLCSKGEEMLLVLQQLNQSVSFCVGCILLDKITSM